MRKILMVAAAAIGFVSTTGIAPCLAENGVPGQVEPTTPQDGAAASPRGGQRPLEQNVQSTGSAHLSRDRAAKIARTLLATASTQAIDREVTVGSNLPGDADVRALPPAVVELAPEYRGYEYAVTRTGIVIVQPATRRVVEVIREVP